MPGKRAAVDYDVCRPEICDSGVCKAAKACPRRLLKQEAPYETPMPTPTLCQACAVCVRACPVKAIRLE